MPVGSVLSPTPELPNRHTKYWPAEAVTDAAVHDVVEVAKSVHDGTVTSEVAAPEN